MRRSVPYEHFWMLVTEVLYRVGKLLLTAITYLERNAHHPLRDRGSARNTHYERCKGCHECFEVCHKSTCAAHVDDDYSNCGVINIPLKGNRATFQVNHLLSRSVSGTQFIVSEDWPLKVSVLPLRRGIVVFLTQGYRYDSIQGTASRVLCVAGRVFIAQSLRKEEKSVPW